MWPRAIDTAAAQSARSPAAPSTGQETVRMFGLAESGLAEALREAEARIAGFTGLEITTCLRRGELEIVTRYRTAHAAGATGRWSILLRASAIRGSCSPTDGALIDDQVAALLAGHASSPPRNRARQACWPPGWLDRAGSSAYLVGGVVSYSNEAKVRCSAWTPH